MQSDLERVYRHVKANPLCSKEQLKQWTRCKYCELDRHLYTLTTEGKITINKKNLYEVKL